MLLYITKKFIYRVLSSAAIIRSDLKTNGNDLIFTGHKSYSSIMEEFDNVIYTCSFDDTTMIKWNSTDATILHQYDINTQHIEGFGDKLYVSVNTTNTKDYYITEIDINTNDIVKNYTGLFFDALYDIQVTEDVLYATTDKFIVSWNRKTGEQINKIGTVDPLYGLVIVNNNIYSSYETKTYIERWNLDFTNKEVIEGVAPNGTNWIRRQDNILVFGSRYNYITMFDTVKGTIKKLDYDLSKKNRPYKVYVNNNILYIEIDGLIDQYDINRSSDILVNSSKANFGLKRTDMETKGNITTFLGHTDTITNAIEYKDFVYSSSLDSALIKWDGNNGSKIYEHNMLVNYLYASEDKVYASVDDRSTDNCYISEIDTSANTIVKNYTGALNKMLYFTQSTATTLYASTIDNVIMWNISTGKKIKELKTVSTPYGLILIQDYIYINYNGTTFIEKWDLEMAKKEVIEDVNPDGAYWSIVQDNLIIFGSITNVITIFDTKTYSVRKLQHSLTTEDRPNSARIHNNILYIEADNYIREFDLKESTLISAKASVSNNGISSLMCKLEIYIFSFLILLLL
ncbi:hypothetical protein HDU92_008472 [Lobulomyces angularis]|nr:hypothetical protein HDU92_008472 [Lobulomyces angularis]